MIDQYDIAIPGGPRTSLSMGERRLLLATLRDALGIDAGWLRNRVLAARAARSDRPRLVVAPVETVDDWTPLHAQGGWS